MIFYNKKKTMKKIFLFLIIILTVFTSCNSDAVNENKCLDSVIKAYPNSTIYVDLEDPFYYYVVDSIGLILVKTMSPSSPDITSTIRLTKVQK